MLTPEQIKTIDFDARVIIDGHLATLHGVLNRVLDPSCCDDAADSEG